MDPSEDHDRHGPLRAWRAGRSDRRLQLLSILSLSVAFICLAASLLVVTNIAAVRDRWSRAGRATIYLRETTSETEILDLVRALEATPGVKKVRHVTAMEARREVVFDEGDRALASLPPSAFPASLEVGFGEQMGEDALAAMTVKLRSLPAVETVETYQRWTERLSSLLGGGVTASVCLALIVLCAVMSVITSTTRLLLQRRRVEVEVLKLVGATDAFVRRPFVVEAAVQGATGAALAIAIVGALFLMVSGRFDIELAGLLGVSPSFLPWPVTLGMVALGGALGAVTALLSLRKMVVTG
jgi:cell division transport system permease protein